MLVILRSSNLNVHMKTAISQQLELAFAVKRTVEIASRPAQGAKKSGLLLPLVLLLLDCYFCSAE